MSWKIQCGLIKEDHFNEKMQVEMLWRKCEELRTEEHDYSGQTQENGAVLDEEQSLFLAGETDADDCDALDLIVDERGVQNLALLTQVKRYYLLYGIESLKDPIAEAKRPCFTKWTMSNLKFLHPGMYGHEVSLDNCDWSFDSSINSKRVVINSNSESVNSASNGMCVVNVLNSVNATPTIRIVLHKDKQIWKPKGKLSDNSFNKAKQIWKPKGKLSDNSLNKTKQIWKPKNKLSDNSLSKTQRVWKATGKLFAEIGHQWRPTGKKLTLGKLDCGSQWRPTGKKFALGEMCHLTKLSVKCSTLYANMLTKRTPTIIGEPILQTLQTRLFSNAGRTGHALVSGLGLLKTYDGESFKAHEFCGKVHRIFLKVLSKLGKSRKFSNRPKSELQNGSSSYPSHGSVRPMRSREHKGTVGLTKTVRVIPPQINGTEFVQPSSVCIPMKVLAYLINSLFEDSLLPQPRKSSENFKPKLTLEFSLYNGSVRISSGPEPKMMFGQNSSSLVFFSHDVLILSSGLAPQCLKMFEHSSSSLGLHCQKTFKQISSNLVSQMSQRRLLASLQAPFLKEKKGVRFSALYLQKKRNLLVLDHSHHQVSIFVHARSVVMLINVDQLGLALELDKSISVTEAEEEAVAREFMHTHGKICEMNRTAHTKMKSKKIVSKRQLELEAQMKELGKRVPDEEKLILEWDACGIHDSCKSQFSPSPYVPAVQRKDYEILCVDPVGLSFHQLSIDQDGTSTTSQDETIGPSVHPEDATSTKMVRETLSHEDAESGGNQK
ncbi:hypothetical protein Tco_1145697 [Tanacetum coccineum]